MILRNEVYLRALTDSYILYNVARYDIKGRQFLKTLERELAPLKEIKDNYPKTLLTLDHIGNGANYEGIKQKNLIDWLLEL